MNKPKFIVLTHRGDGSPMAYHLQQEGYDVTLGIVEDVAELKCDKPAEDPETKKERLAQYDGMIKKIPAKKLVKALLKVENKDEYFIFCDFNSLWFYGEILLKAGFKHGLMPTQKDYEFEKSREGAIEFVKKNYPGIETIPFTEVKNVDEAVKFLDENEGVFVIQSEGDFVSTYVPQTDEPEIAKEQSIGQLNKYKADYDKGGIILKTKLIDPIEITPQIVFYNGKPVFTDLDIETKNMGNGKNNGPQVGCGQNLIISTEMDEKINKLAFPPIVYEMAKEHTGLFVWDISLYLHEGKIYFGEFCSNRLGYDAAITEMTMAGGVGSYFISIMNGQNPLKNKFGTATRVFNICMTKDQTISFKGIEDYTWCYEIRKEGDEMVSTGESWDLATITCASDSLDDAISGLYDHVGQFSFKEGYNRTEDDFRADYPTSIMNRYNAINHKWIEAPDTKAVTDLRGQLEKEYQDKLASEVGSIKKLIKKALYGEK